MKTVYKYDEIVIKIHYFLGENCVIMSLTLTLTGKNSTLSVNYFPPIDLSDGSYELGLIDFETFNTIPNINSTNNKFYFDNDVIEIPVGSYELDAISKYLRREIIKRRPLNENVLNNEEYPIVLRANNNTMKSEILSAFTVDFNKPDNLGSVLGFTQDQTILPKVWYESTKPVNIINVNMLGIECNITGGSFSNSKPVHTIHEFPIRVPPGYKISETPFRVIYLPIVGQIIDDLTLRVVDQNGGLIDFRGEEVTVRLHVRRQAKDGIE